MIISVRSISYDELKGAFSKNDKIVIWSCDSCIKQCGLGGSEKMSHLKSVLDEDGYNITATELISVSCHTPLIEERKYNEEKKHFMEQADAIIVLACEDGYHCVKSAFKDKNVIGTAKTVGGGGKSPAGAVLNTPFESTGLENSVKGHTLDIVAEKLNLYHTFFESDRKFPEEDPVEITVNGKKCTALEGENLLKACEKNGFKIPHLCYREGLSAPGSCRLCLVKIKGRKGLAPSCRQTVSKGMEVTTDDDELRYLRRIKLESLLAANEHNCLLCGENRIMRGKCELQTFARDSGVESVSFPVDREPLPIDDSHPVIIKDPNKCVLCGRCVRACSELAGKHNLGIASMGKETVIASGMNQLWNESACAGCLACVMVCPTGALTERLLHFKGENWEPEKIFI
ncbi:MAG: hypothetical protein BA867_03085 [Desulfobacterales bacterium S5133MH16]|nr:MAG: hypothetical protein BA867_03085 [Desulfobacterales bacterium S5133MH16]